MTDVSAEVDKALPKAAGGLAVHSFHGAVLVPAVGVVIQLNLNDEANDKWSSGEVVAVPARELASPEAALARFVKAIGRLERPRIAEKAMTVDVASALGLDEPDYPADAFEPTAADVARRREAAVEVDARFEAVAARLREVFGLRLPRHIGVLAAFIRGLSPIEARAFSHYGYWSAGILDWFEDGGLERVPLDGTDPRLHWRYRCDPPEFVTVLRGNTDGLHFGLWYDDPAELPSFIVENYARDDGVSRSRGCTTVLQHLSERIDERAEDADEPPGALDRAFSAAIRAVRPADDAAVVADGPLRWASCSRPGSAAGVGPALPGGLASAFWPSYEADSVREARYGLRALRVARYVREARAELEAGRPGPALLVGRELFWTEDEHYDAEMRELLMGAYAALGRGALADTLRAHLAGRSRPSLIAY